tara:strand:+ start:828 stop:1361 length:534 start_codon:yes stop_codon:yes gene_type:complete
MKSKSYTIPKESIQALFSKLISDKWIGVSENTKHITNLLSSLPEEYVSNIICLMLANRELIPLKIGNTVMYKPPSYSSNYDRDIMIDKGLMTNDGYIYGTITGDGSWGDDDFNPYHGSMKVDVYVWNNNQIEDKEESVKSIDLIVIDKDSLPKFNDKSHLEFFEEIIENPNQTKIEI